MELKYSARYSGPTDTRGSRIIVHQAGYTRQKSYGFDYAARDAFASAVAKFAGVSESKVERVVGEGNADRHIFSVTL